MVSYSVSYWKTKMDQFSQLELCRTAKAEFVQTLLLAHIFTPVLQMAGVTGVVFVE